MTIKAGMLVRIKPEILKRLVAAEARRLDGRIGWIDGTYTPQGGATLMARVIWLHRKTKKPLDGFDIRPARDLVEEA